MNQWQSFLVLWPRRIDGDWRWLSRRERRAVYSGCGQYGDVSYEYRSDGRENDPDWLRSQGDPYAETQRSSHANGSDEKDDPVAA
jgi:hypothetical protein